MLRVASCDVLYVHLQRRGTDHMLERHRQTAQTFDLLLAVCESPQMLEAWSYSVFQQQWLVQRLGPVVGAGNMTTCQATDAVELQRRNTECEGLEESPFLLPLMCALISPQFKLFPVAGLLASARRGWWAEDDTVFMVDESLSSRARTGVWGVVESAPIQDMGKVTVILHGSDVVLIRFSVSWPKIARPTNSHFMPDQCRLHLVHPKRPEHSLVQTPNTDVAYLSLGLPAWERRLGKNLPIELRIILEGNYCVSRTGPWWTPILCAIIAPGTLKLRKHIGLQSLSGCGRGFWSMSLGSAGFRCAFYLEARYPKILRLIFG